MNFELLLRVWAEKKGTEEDTKILDMVTYTLTKMAQGGMYDHVGKVSIFIKKMSSECYKFVVARLEQKLLA